MNPFGCGMRPRSYQRSEPYKGRYTTDRGVLAEVPGVGVISRDKQDGPRRDPLYVRQQREVHERQLARQSELGDGVRVVTARRRVELAEFAAYGIGVLVEPNGRAALGKD